MKLVVRAFLVLVLLLTGCTIQAQTNPIFYGTVQFKNSSFAGSTARFPPTMLGSGVPSSSLVLFGDGVWRSIGTVRVSAVNGTPNEIAALLSGSTVTLSLPAALTFTGKTITGGTFNATALNGPLTGNVTGNLTGDVTGNLTGNVTGSLSGNASSATIAGLASQVFIANDTTTSAIMHLAWVTGSPDTGYKALMISNSKFLVNPFTGQLYATNFMGTHTGNVIGGGGSFTSLSSTLPMKNGGWHRVSSDVVVSASTTLTDITGLSADLVTGLTYSFHAVLLVTQSSTGGYTITLAAYGGLTATDVRFTVKGFLGTSGVSANAATVSQLISLGGGPVSIFSTASGNGEIEINGTITVNAGGILQVQGAQQSAVGTSTFKQGSFLEVVQQPL